MGVIAKGTPRGCQVNKVTSTSLGLGYPLSVFNKKLYSQNVPGLQKQGLEDETKICPVPRAAAASPESDCSLRATVGFREVETTVFDPASVFLSTH